MDKWTIIKIADYWRLLRDGYLIASFRTRADALKEMRIAKRLVA